MEQFGVFIVLFGVIAVVGQLFSQSTIPTALLLVMVGMLLSFVPGFGEINLNHEVVLNIFLPLLVYQISSYTSWKDVKKNIRPIALLSIGHVIFIAVVIAVIMHSLIPQLGWPLAFVLGAVIAPPDTVAIVAIAEKIHMPRKMITILEGEGMLNDATALTLFRFALAAVATHQFQIFHAVAQFFVVVVCETIYGLLIGYVIAEFRLKIRNSMLHVIVSLLTPFLAYLPAEKLGGSGVLATVAAGFVIGHLYATRFTPEFRLISNAVWPATAFGIESILFLLVGLDFRLILQKISTISPAFLLLYGLVVIATVILGRFIWVYFFGGILPRFLLPFTYKKSTLPSWQNLFAVSWAGMRGGISLAAALAVPTLPIFVQGANARDLLIFLVFCVIIATLLLQGLTLPSLLKKLGVKKYGQQEKYHERLAELHAKLKMVTASLLWLKTHKTQVMQNKNLLDEVQLRIAEYRMIKQSIKDKITNHAMHTVQDEKIELTSNLFLLTNIIEIERNILLQLWQNEEVTLAIRNKLLNQLDHRSRHLTG